MSKTGSSRGGPYRLPMSKRPVAEIASRQNQSGNSSVALSNTRTIASSVHLATLEMSAVTRRRRPWRTRNAQMVFLGLRPALGGPRRDSPRAGYWARPARFAARGRPRAPLRTQGTWSATRSPRVSPQRALGPVPAALARLPPAPTRLARTVGTPLGHGGANSVPRQCLSKASLPSGAALRRVATGSGADPA